MTNYSSSSTNQPNVPPSSTEPPNDVQAWQKLFFEVTKPRTPAQIRAAGEIKVRLGVLWLVGIISAILGIFGGIIFLKDPQNAKDFWVIIGPIISAGVTGTVAFLTGEKRNK